VRVEPKTIGIVSSRDT